MSGEVEMSAEDTIGLLLACAEKDAAFFRSLHRRLPRMRTKMLATYNSYTVKRQLLRDVFSNIDADGSGVVDQKEMQQFFGITGNGGRALKYSEEQLALMTQEDKDLLLVNDDLTAKMDLSGDGELTFSEFMRFFLGNNPDGSAEDMEGNLQDLGYLAQGKAKTFAETHSQQALQIEAPTALQAHEQQAAP